jgi:hypothetical protein
LVPCPIRVRRPAYGPHDSNFSSGRITKLSLWILILRKQSLFKATWTLVKRKQNLSIGRERLGRTNHISMPSHCYILTGFAGRNWITIFFSFCFPFKSLSDGNWNYDINYLLNSRYHFLISNIFIIYFYYLFSLQAYYHSPVMFLIFNWCLKYNYFLNFLFIITYCNYFLILITYLFQISHTKLI